MALAGAKKEDGISGRNLQLQRRVINSKVFSGQCASFQFKAIKNIVIY